MSFSLAILACKLYVSEVFKISKISIPVQRPLQQEFEERASLDNWSSHPPWRSEHHLSKTVFSDASQRAGGAVLIKHGLSQQIRDYWVEIDSNTNVLEARALCNALSSFNPSISNAMVDLWTDNVKLQAAWEKGGCKSSLVNQEMKKIEGMSRPENFALHLRHFAQVTISPMRLPVLCQT